MDIGDIIFGVIVIAVIGLIVGGIAWGIGSIIDENNRYQDSVKEEVITIKSISPAPGLGVNEFGQLMVSNAQQLMFYTTDGRGFQNTEDERVNKYETRDLLMNLKIGGTYKVKYVGWRDGQKSEYPNILAIVEVKNESGAVGFSWNDFLGDWNIKNLDMFDISNYKVVDGKLTFTGEEADVDVNAYKNQTSQNKIISDRINNND